MTLQSIRFNSILLASFALITAIILASTDSLTKDKIAASERAAAQRALLEIIPLERHNNDLLMDVQPIPEKFWLALGLQKGGDIHIARGKRPARSSDYSHRDRGWLQRQYRHDYRRQLRWHHRRRARGQSQRDPGAGGQSRS